MSQAAFIDEQIAQLKERGLDDIVILTCKTESSSVFRDYAKNGFWRLSGVKFSTCRKFKGLEADAVILVDVDESIWESPTRAYDPEPGLVFYTGASRAKHELRIVCDMGERGCLATLALLGIDGKRKPVSRLAKQLGAVNVSK